MSISALVYERFGINLTDRKKALVQGRLNSLVKSLGFTNFSDYYEAVVEDQTGRNLLGLVDRLSTNHSKNAGVDNTHVQIADIGVM